MNRKKLDFQNIFFYIFLHFNVFSVNLGVQIREGAIEHM